MVWKAVAVVFYIELVICFILMFPLLRPSRWKRLLHSSLMTTFWSYGKFYFIMFGLLLIGLFIGAWKGIQKQQEKKQHPNLTPEETNRVLEQLFRAQRNYFITMFATLLFFVLYRIGSLILAQANLEDEEEEIQKQLRITAEMVTQASTGPVAQENERIRLELYDANDEIKKLKEKLRDAEKDKEMMQADLENLGTEIKVLSNGCSEMKAKLTKDDHHQGVLADKKD